jgi:hypothetical protein
VYCFIEAKFCHISEVCECDSSAQFITYKLGICVKVSLAYSFCQFLKHCAVLFIYLSRH